MRERECADPLDAGAAAERIRAVGHGLAGFECGCCLLLDAGYGCGDHANSPMQNLRKSDACFLQMRSIAAAGDSGGAAKTSITE